MVETVATSVEEFRELLKDTSFVMDRFSVNLVAPILKGAGKPEAGKLLSF